MSGSGYRFGRHTVRISAPGNCPSSLADIAHFVVLAHIITRMARFGTRAIMQEMTGQHSDAAAPNKSAAALPGAVLALVIAITSGIVFGGWALPRIAGADQTDGLDGTSVLAPVARKDLSDALTTMSISSTGRAALEKQSKDCGPPLAWISIARAPGQPAGEIRLQSGSYFSPLFPLGDSPVRIAIPYPAPYATGHGVLAAFVAGGAAIVRLTPSWHVTTLNGRNTQNVTWHPATCETRDG